MFYRGLVFGGLAVIALFSPLSAAAQNPQRVGNATLSGTNYQRVNRDQFVGVNAVPEPAFYQGLALVLLGGIGLWRIRRKARKTA